MSCNLPSHTGPTSFKLGCPKILILYRLNLEEIETSHLLAVAVLTFTYIIISVGNVFAVTFCGYGFAVGLWIKRETFVANIIETNII